MSAPPSNVAYGPAYQVGGWIFYPGEGYTSLDGTIKHWDSSVPIQDHYAVWSGTHTSVSTTMPNPAYGPPGQETQYAPAPQLQDHGQPSPYDPGLVEPLPHSYRSPSYQEPYQVAGPSTAYGWQHPTQLPAGSPPAGDHGHPLSPSYQQPYQVAGPSAAYGWQHPTQLPADLPPAGDHGMMQSRSTFLDPRASPLPAQAKSFHRMDLEMRMEEVKMFLMRRGAGLDGRATSASATHPSNLEYLTRHQPGWKDTYKQMREEAKCYHAEEDRKDAEHRVAEYTNRWGTNGSNLTTQERANIRQWFRRNNIPLPTHMQAK